MDDEFDEVVSEFLVESYENLDRLDQDLLAMEEDPSETSTLASAFRTIHTIKGTCGFLGYSRLERVTHVGENLLSRLRDGALILNPEITSALLEMVDAVRAMLGAIEATGEDGADDYPALTQRLSSLAEPSVISEPEQLTEEAEPAPVAEPTLAAEPQPQPVGAILMAAGATGSDEVSLALAEQNLGDHRPLGQILVDHGSVDPAAVDRAVLDQVADATQQGGTDPGASGDGRPGLSESTIRVDVGVLDRLMNLVGELVLSRNNILQHVSVTPEPAIVAAAQQLDLVTGELQGCVMKTRMQPIGTVWSKFSRVVRDLAIQCDKRVRLEMEGAETELDKTILEAIKDPLTHIVRNTVDHGIESPDQRVAAGKDPEGVLRMRARHEGGQVIIEIADDGGGIDPQRIVAKAVDKGIVTAAQATNLSDRDAVNLIFAPGFSTSEVVTNVSGRGVGMDVVKTNIENISGTVEVDSELGVGTTLRIKIPLTLAIVPALLIECDGLRYAVPQIEVLELVRLDAASAGAVETVHNAPVYRLRGDLLPLIYLRDELELDPADPESTMTIVVVTTEGQSWGLVVDGVTSTEEIVVKPLSGILRSVAAFAGATIMGDGQVSLILDIAGLARSSQVLASADRVRAERPDHSDLDAGSRTKLLVVKNGEQQLAIDLADIDRLEQFEVGDIEVSGSVDVIQYRDRILPLSTLGRPADGTTLTTVVFARQSQLVGLIVEEIVDIVEAVVGPTDRERHSSIVVRDRVTELLDVEAALYPATSWLDRNSSEVFA